MTILDRAYIVNDFFVNLYKISYLSLKLELNIRFEKN